MSTALWAACVAWILVALGIAAHRGTRAVREGAGPKIAARLKSPTVYLFAGYLLVAAFVTPLSPGESTSPLLWLALVVPGVWALATVSAAGTPRGPARAIGSAVLFGGTVIAASAIVLALASPRFVPAWMR